MAALQAQKAALEVELQQARRRHADHLAAAAEIHSRDISAEPSAAPQPEEAASEALSLEAAAAAAREPTGRMEEENGAPPKTTQQRKQGAATKPNARSKAKAKGPRSGKAATAAALPKHRQLCPARVSQPRSSSANQKRRLGSDQPRLELGVGDASAADCADKENAWAEQQHRGLAGAERHAKRAKKINYSELSDEESGLTEADMSAAAAAVAADTSVTSTGSSVLNDSLFDGVEAIDNTCPLGGGGGRPGNGDAEGASGPLDFDAGSWFDHRAAPPGNFKSTLSKIYRNQHAAPSTSGKGAPKGAGRADRSRNKLLGRRNR